MATPGSLGLVTQEPPQEIYFESWAISLTLEKQHKAGRYNRTERVGEESNLSFLMSLQ